MKGILILASSLIVLAGCTKTVEEMSYSEQKALSQQIVKRCMDQGVRLQSKEMDKCLYVEAQREVYGRRNAVSRERQAAAAIGAGMAGYGAGLQRSAAASTVPASRTMNCRTQPMGAGTYNTSCY